MILAINTAPGKSTSKAVDYDVNTDDDFETAPHLEYHEHRSVLSIHSAKCRSVGVFFSKEISAISRPSLIHHFDADRPDPPPPVFMLFSKILGLQEVSQDLSSKVITRDLFGFPSSPCPDLLQTATRMGTGPPDFCIQSRLWTEYQ